MDPQLRPLTNEDAGAVLRINEEIVHKLAPLDEPTYRWFVEAAALALAATIDDEVVGFVLVLEPGLDYASDNYRWFSERYDDFAYLDRVAIDELHRRKGVGGVIYDAVESWAAAHGRPVLLEVNEQPANEPSLAFHAGRGYEPVGTLAHGDGPDAKVVRLLAWRSAGADDQRS